MFLKLSKWSLYGAFFAPVVVTFWGFFPFIGGKYYFFRGMTELSLIFVILFWGFEARREDILRELKALFRKPLVIAVTVFVGMVLLACLFAYDSHAAFWSNYERGEGGFQMIHYYLFFLLAIFLFREERDWKIALWVAMAAAVLMIIYGIAAAGLVSIKDGSGRAMYAFIGPYARGEASSTFLGRLFDSNVRFQGSLGNPAYVAPYLLFSLFYLFFAWARSGKSKKILMHVAYGGLALFFLTFFFLSQTKGAGIGLGFAIYAFLVYVGFIEPRRRSIMLLTTGTFLALGGALIHLINSRHVIAALTDHSFIDSIRVFLRSIPGSRLFDLPFSGNQLILGAIGAFVLAFLIMFLADKRYRKWALSGILALFVGGVIVVATTGFVAHFQGDQTANTRFWTWGSAWQGFQDRPLLGWGPENFSTVFDKYFDVRHYVPGQNTETWFDRAHSVVFDYLAEIGILGFASYLAVFAVFFWEFTRVKPVSQTSEGNHRGGTRPFGIDASGIARALLIALPVAYLVQGLAIFDVLPIYINLFFFLALGAFLFEKRT